MLSDMVHEVEAAKPQAIYKAITTKEGEAGFWVPNNTMTPKLGHVAAGDRTTVEFGMGNLAGYPPEEVGPVNYTWGQVVGRLKAFVETGTPQPFLE